MLSLQNILHTLTEFRSKTIMNTNQIKRFFTLSFGNVIEWYDFSLYGYFAIIISQIYFPSSSAFASLIAAFSAFAIGFLARPLGGIVFGLIGDKVGREYAINLCIFTMSLPTLGIALLPGYDTLGIAAPLLLIAMRVLQGLSTGGQFSGMLVVAKEQAPKACGFYNGISYSVSVAGFLLASLMGYIVISITPKSLHHFAWRIPFLLSGLLFISYYFAHRRLAKIQPKKGTSSPDENTSIKHLFTDHPKQITQAGILAFCTTGFFYLIFTYFIAFQERVLKFSLQDSLLTNSVALILAIPLFPLFGKLTDKYGARSLFIGGNICLLALSAPLFKMILSGNHELFIIGFLCLTLLSVFTISTITPIYAELFPKAIRSTGCNFSFGLGVALSGLLPLVSSSLVEINPFYMPWIFITLAALAIATMRWTNKQTETKAPAISSIAKYL